jgi:ubiquinone biosynthesis UbiH/UbiF/VisC/COQ6 family hydroxylase
MIQTKEYDVIVSGAGAVGLAAVLALSQQGMRVALVDPRVPSLTVGDPERAIALSEGSRRLLDEWGVWSEIKTLGCGTIRHIEVCEAQARGRVAIHGDELQLDAMGYVVEMAHVLTPMWQKVQDCADVFCPAIISQRQVEDDATVLTVLKGDEQRQLRARLLVVADGGGSPLRRMAGIGTYGWSHNRFAIVASILTAVPHHDTAYECFRNDGPLALLPMADGRLSLVWAVPPDEAMFLLECTDDVFLGALTQAIQGTPAMALGAMQACGKRGSFPLELRLAKRLTGARLVLAGNAAHTIHPVAGQGLNLGLRDVCTLSNVLNSSIGRDDPGHTVLLQQYASAQQLDVCAVSGFTEGLLSAFASQSVLAQQLRAALMFTVQPNSPWKRWFLRHAAGVAKGEG